MTAAATSSPAIEAAALTKSWGARRGVEDVSFAVAPGEVFGFLGPNGAGKTTTIRALMGFVRPTAGEARVFGLDAWRDAPRVQALVGFVAGDASLYGNLTALEHLRLLGRLRGLGEPPRLREIARRFELDLGVKVRQLSKGNRQKVALVAAFMHDPPLLVLDEPTSGLDPLMQHAFVELVQEERDRGKTVFLSSHLVHEVERICTRVAIVREGRLVAVDAVQALRDRSARRLVVTFAADPDPALLSLPDAPVVTRQGRQVAFAVGDGFGPLLRRLADQPIDELSYAPPDLEAVFQSYYNPTAN